MTQEERSERLRRLGLIGGDVEDLRSLVDRHSILLGRLAADPFIGGILFGMESINVGEVLIGVATFGLLFTTSHQDIPGATVTLPTSGTWAVTGVFDIQSIGTGDDNQVATGVLDVDGTVKSQQAIYHLRGTAPIRRATVSQMWSVVAVSPGVVLKLRARKLGGTGTSKANATHTNIVATRTR